MSATREDLERALLDLEDKHLKLASLYADTLLTQVHTRFEPWKFVAAAVGTAGVFFGAAAAVGAFVARSSSH